MISRWVSIKLIYISLSIFNVIVSDILLINLVIWIGNISVQDSMELHYKQSKAVAVTCFSFLSGDVNNFVVGSEECTVYTACRHGR